MDRGCCLEILEGYGVGPDFCRLLAHFWDEAGMVCQAGGYYDKEPFKAGRGVTQEGPLSPQVFDIMVNAIIHEWLCVEVGIEEAETWGRNIMSFWQSSTPTMAS